MSRGAPFALLLLLPAGLLSAADPAFRRRAADGGVPGEWLSALAPGGREAGLAGAGSALEGAAAAASNPAALAGGQGGEVEFLAAPLHAGGQFQSVSIAHAVSTDEWVGATFRHLGSGEAERTDLLGQTIGSFDERNFAFQMTFARRRGRLTAGAAAKAVNQSVADFSATGLGLDAGIQFRPAAPLSLALAAQNALAPRLRLRDEADRFPLTLRAGAAWTFRVKGRRVALAADLSSAGGLAAAPLRWALGGEASSAPESALPVAFRLGINHREFTLGAGVGKGPWRLDYSAAFHELGILHRLGVSIRYGVLSPFAEEKLERDRREVREREKEVSRLKAELENERKTLEKQVAWKSLVREGERLLAADRLDEARQRFFEAKKVSPAEPEIAAFGKRVDKREAELKAETYYGLAKDLYEEARYDEALALARDALAQDRAHAGAAWIAHMAEAHLSLEAKNYAVAEKRLADALKLEPGNKEAARLHERLKDVVELDGSRKN